MYLLSCPFENISLLTRHHCRWGGCKIQGLSFTIDMSPLPVKELQNARSILSTYCLWKRGGYFCRVTIVMTEFSSEGPLCLVASFDKLEVIRTNFNPGVFNFRQTINKNTIFAVYMLYVWIIMCSSGNSLKFIDSGVEIIHWQYIAIIFTIIFIFIKQILNYISKWFFTIIIFSTM